MTPCRVAVVGAGYFGNRHAQNFAAMPDCTLVAVCDADPARAHAVAAQYGAAAATDPTGLPGRVDAASIAVPTADHAGIAAFLMAHGIHVLVEKPMTRTLAEADGLIAQAEAAGLVLQVGHVERFNPAASALLPLLHRPRLLDCHRLSPFRPRGTDVSIVLDLMIHDIDLVLAIAQADPVTIEATGRAVVADRHDYAQARLTFPDGMVATLTASRIDPRSSRTLRAYHEGGLVSADLGDGRLTIVRRTDAAPAAVEAEERAFETGNSLRRQLESFVRSVRTGAPPAVTGGDGRRALAVAMAVMDRLDAGRGATVR